MRSRTLILVLLCLLLGPIACADTLRLRDHPLSGRIWDVRAQRFVDAPAFEARLAHAQFVLLGEAHDNPEHHRIQHRVLETLLARGRRPALVMEQFDVEHQAAIDSARRAPGATADEVADAGKFNRRGWDWRFYEPLVARALREEVPLIAANLSRSDARRVAAQGFAALGQERAQRLGLGQAATAAVLAVVRQEIVDGHCGHVPEDLVPRLARSQQARDAVMAEALAAQAASGAVGILGRGHVRRDSGAPLYLGHLLPAADVVAVGMVEVREDIDEPSSYVVAPDAGPLFDYLWFTPQAARPDPCAGLSAEQLRRGAGGT